jgi:hypothetical protein
MGQCLAAAWLVILNSPGIVIAESPMESALGAGTVENARKAGVERPARPLLTKVVTKAPEQFRYCFEMRKALGDDELRWFGYERPPRLN